MNTVKTLVYSVIGGMCISIGGCAFLASDSKIAGAVFFVVGLFTICTFGFNLFTGKVCYALENNWKYAISLLVIWLGNLIGCLILGILLRLTRLTALIEKANTICDTKLGDSLLSVFLLAIFCNILIFIAVDGYKNNPHEIGKYLALFFGVTVFVLCGFEHCVANMFYITAAGRWSGQAVLFIVINTLGNAVGGLLIPALKLLVKGKAKPAADESKIEKEAAPVQVRDSGNYKSIVFTPEDYKGIEINAAGSRESITDSLIDKIAENKGITYPEDLINSETRDLMAGYMQHVKYAAMGSGNMQELNDIDMEKAEQDVRAQVLHDLNEETVIKGILKAESIDVSSEELEKEALRISEEEGTDIELVKRFFGDDFSGLTKDIQKRKARDLIYDTAKLIK